MVKAVCAGTEGEWKKPASTICPLHEPGYCSTSSYPAFSGGSPLYSLAYATQVWEIFFLFHFICPMKFCPNVLPDFFFFLCKLALILNATITHVVTYKKVKISFDLPMKHGSPGKDHCTLRKQFTHFLIPLSGSLEMKIIFMTAGNFLFHVNIQQMTIANHKTFCLFQMKYYALQQFCWTDLAF